LVLSNASNSYTGGTTVGGALQIGTTAAVGSIGAGPITIGDGAALTVVNTRGNVLSNAVASGAGQAGTLLVVSANGNTLSGTLADGVSGSLALTQNGTGTTILTNAGNTYSGATQVQRGTLQVGTTTAGSIGLESAVTVLSGATLKLVKVAGNEIFNAITENLGGTVLLDPIGTLKVDGAISGAGSVLAMGNPAGSLPTPAGPTLAPTILNGNNSYTGATTVSSGTLQIGDGSSGNLAAASAVTVNRGATLALDLAQFATFGNNVTNNGQITLLGGNDTLTGNISGTGSLTRGSGSTTLIGASTYTGATTIQSGGLLLADNANGSATGKGTVTVNADATLGGTGTISGNVILNKGGEIYPEALPPQIFTLSSPVPVTPLGSVLHLGALTWNGGEIVFGVGAGWADEIVLAGPLTKGSAGPWIINVDPARLLPQQPQITLMTFSSTNFTLANFQLNLGLNFSGLLVETKTSLLLENFGEKPLTFQGGRSAGGLGVSVGSEDVSAGASVATESRGELVSGISTVPEPGGVALLVLGGGAVLGWRRRRG
jgi:autotransporter-associated beta strand protein